MCICLTVGHVQNYDYVVFYVNLKVYSEFTVKMFLKYIITVNLLQPTGYVTHQQFNIKQLYPLPTLCLYVLYLSENKQRLVPLTALTDWFL